MGGSGPTPLPLAAKSWMQMQPILGLYQPILTLGPSFANPGSGPDTINFLLHFVDDELHLQLVVFSDFKLHPYHLVFVTWSERNQSVKETSLMALSEALILEVFHLFI